MDKQIRRIGVLTSGGDAPGMNALIRAVVRTASAHDISVLGVRRGYSGLINGDIIEMGSRSVDGIIRKGGTMLYTARCKEMMTDEGLQKAADTCKYLGIDGLICCGGDGTFRGAQALSRMGVPCIGVPGTIDNDIVCTDYTIGFDTACNTAIECIDKLRDTMQSHERCSVVEVMGRRAGHLALHVGCAVGATAILLPEREIDFDTELVEKMRVGRIKGRNHHIIIVAEGYGSAQEVADRIHESTGIDTRVTILGHIQRGGSPTARDRVMATRMGYEAVMALEAGKTNRVIVFDDNRVTDLDIEEGLARQKDLEQDLFLAQQTVAI
ncbi:6-phosphofructokinase [Butyricicoccus faecihominis]|uniref:6-phosphofructokinase n=1 Tax=Butyricicoccaceae TaxID=3085642 RepID=UPI00247A4172|nr:MULTISPECIES: 6-phosphofructokinase [Butyricicoccaceae]MCQ5130180.1 6-phosphofructokinase [Butyricicoccus faecihominis]WNX83097.1 6-phosphofructokinase [Agathobaculum sp. NTUH-O15-33]